MIHYSLTKRLQDFYKDPAALMLFESHTKHASLQDLLYPQVAAYLFPEQFMISYRKRKLPFPLILLPDRLNFVEIKLLHMFRSPMQELHSLVIFQVFRKFQSSLRIKEVYQEWILTKELLLSPAQLNRCMAYKKIQSLKRYLNLPRSFLDEPSDASLQKKLYAALNQTYLHYQSTSEELHLKEVEIEMLQIELHKKKNQQPFSQHSRDNDSNSSSSMAFAAQAEENMQKLMQKNQELQKNMQKEQEYIDELEFDITKLSETILKMQDLNQESQLMQEYRNLQEDYESLTAKIKNLSQKNNELQQTLGTQQRQELSDSLDVLRDRVNALLYNASASNTLDTVQALRAELNQLQRSRIYFNKTLNNIETLCHSSKFT